MPTPYATLGEFDATGYAQAQNPQYPGTPIGWGYMDPMVVRIGNDVYEPLLYPTSITGSTALLYNIQLVKNGSGFGPALSMAYTGIPAGYSTEDAYQPPMLFARGSLIIAAYWVEIASSSPASIVQFMALDTSAASPAWNLLATYWAPAGHTFNYLGGAIGPSGEIYVAGWDSNGDNSALSLVRLDTAGNAAVEAIYSTSNPYYKPIYPSLTVAPDGTVFVLVTFSNMATCASTGANYTNYKNVALYRGVFPNVSQAVFSDAGADVVASPSTNGDPCQWANERFPTDLIYDPLLGAISIVRKLDYLTQPPASPSAPYGQRMAVYLGANLAVADLSPYFAPVIPAGTHVDAVSITKAGADFVLFGNSRDNPNSTRIAILTTTDFKTFSAPVSVPTKYGAGNSVKVLQPYKNGSSVPTNRVPFWFSGDLYYGDGLNDFLRFFLGTLFLP